MTLELLENPKSIYIEIAKNIFDTIKYIYIY